MTFNIHDRNFPHLHLWLYITPYDDQHGDSAKSNRLLETGLLLRTNETEQHLFDQMCHAIDQNTDILIIPTIMMVVQSHIMHKAWTHNRVANWLDE